MKTSRIVSFLVCAAILSACGNEKDQHESKESDTAVTNAQPPAAQDSAPGTMPSPSQDATFEIKTIKTELGWGYDVYMNGSMYVHQPHIPAISGNKGFTSEEDAKRTAELVIHKIRNNIVPPSLSVDELDSLGVIKK